MRPRGDDGREMPRHEPFDDGAVDALLAGDHRDGDAAALSAFVEDVRAATEAEPSASPALAAALAAGRISINDDPPIATWRKLRMKIQGFLAGLGVAGKLALGAGVAAAATTGAGAAGVLPGPVQEVVSDAVGKISPFHLPDGDDEHDAVADDETTTTTVADDETTPTTKKQYDSDKKKDENKTTPTTKPAPVEDDDTTDETTPTTKFVWDDGTDDDEPYDDGKDDDYDDGKDDDHSTPPTTKPPVDDDDGDEEEPANPESIDLECFLGDTYGHIVCEWGTSGHDDHYKYLVMRTKNGNTEMAYYTRDGFRFEDETPDAGFDYTYKIVEVNSDWDEIGHSNAVTVSCCGDAPDEGDGAGGSGGEEPGV
jgi:hypothetical protein